MKAELAEAESKAVSAKVGVPMMQTTTSSGTTGAEAQVAAAQAEYASAQSSYEQARTSQLAMAGADVAKGQADFDKTQADLQRMKPLVAKDEISKQQYDGFVNAASVAESELKSAQEKLQQARQNVQIQQTVAQLAHLAHWNYAVASYDPANPATFSSAIDTALSKHANYIVEAGIPVAPAILQQVEQAGAKLAVTAVYPIVVKPPVIVNASADNSTQGNLMADYFVSDSNGKGNAVIEHVPGYAILDGFTNAFTARVKALCPGCTTTTTNVTLPELAAGQLVPTVISALKRNPSANYVVFDDGPFATGITSALAAAGLSKVKVIGEAADSAGLAALRAGTEVAWTGYSSPYATLQVVDAMFRDAEGLPIPEAQEGVQQTQLLTKANVGSVTEWNYPTDALQQFKALWQVSGR